MRIATLLLTVLALSVTQAAEFRVANVFSDHMVLQRDQPVRVWGWAEGESKVSVEFGDQQAIATADAMGRWLVTLKSLDASSDGRVLTVRCGEETQEFDDVVVGDVWICGGQSNMEWTLRGSRDADLEVQSADTPQIRFIRLPKVARATPQDDFPLTNDMKLGRWQRCIPEEVENCTAVGYYFARRIHRRLRVPVGLIDNSWGGTMAQHWATTKTLRGIPEMGTYFEAFETARREWNRLGGEEGAARRYAEAMAKWEVARKKAEADGQRIPGRPNGDSFGNPAHKRQPAGMMNGCLMPIRNCSLKGVLFYQGENNSFGTSWKPFYKSYPAVVSDWRKVLGRDDLPFGLVQIAGWSNRRSMTYDMNHHTNVVREIQFDTWQKTPDTGLIVTFDTNSSQSIHPGRKLPVGERLARWALAEVYDVKDPSGRDIAWKGPVYESMEIEGNKVRIRFEKGTADGLVLDQDVDVGFYIAGEDKEFHHAHARTDGRSGELLVWHDEIESPVAVRYGFSNLPTGGLMNRRELPAYPFRTDNWLMTPHQSTGSYLRGHATQE